MKTFRAGNCAWDISRKALLVGVLNVTPDSFSDGGRYANPADAVARAKYLITEGAHILDIGGESTRPGADPVSLEMELDRVLPAIRAIRDAGLSAPISIDTQKAEVARRAIDAGADLVNDVTALKGDPAMGPLVAGCGVPVILMHNRGTSAHMYEKADYRDVVAEVRAELEKSASNALSMGIAPERIVLDPGIGFAKKAAHSWAVLEGLAAIVSLGYPVLVGTSRKSFLRDVYGEDPTALERGTQATSIAAFLRGARLLRVHEPGPLREIAVANESCARGSS